MKLDRCVLAVVAVMGLAAAGTGCSKAHGSDASNDPDQGPPGAQTPPDPGTPPNGDDDSGMRRARRHRGRNGRGRWHRGGAPGDNRGGNRDFDPPRPPSGPDSANNG
jgi:hypothetical protein